MSAPKSFIAEQELIQICYGTYKGSQICQRNNCTETAEYQLTLGTTATLKGCYFTILVCKIHIECFLRPSGGKSHA